jgi:hypothetical protein
MQDMLDVNFKFYKFYVEEPNFAEFLRDVLYDRYLREHKGEMYNSSFIILTRSNSCLFVGV